MRNLAFSATPAALAKALVIRNYVAKERLPVGQLYILRRGLCVKMWRFLGIGKVRAPGRPGATPGRRVGLGWAGGRGRRALGGGGGGWAGSY